MSRASRKVISVGFVLVLGVLIGSAFLTQGNLRTLARNAGWVEHTREVVAALEATLSILKDAETGQRGYLLTGRAHYLDPYQSAVAELPQALDRLAALTADNSSQQARLGDLRRLSAAKMAELRQTVELRGQKGFDAALEVVMTDKGKNLMEDARNVVTAMKRAEEQLLAARTEASRAALRGTIATYTVSSGLALGLLLLVYYFKRRDDIETARAAEAVRQEREWLATTLTSIGDAVIATDAEGRARLLNPIAQTLTGWTQAEAEGRPLEEVFNIINESTRQPALNPVARVLSEGRVVGLANHTAVIARDGTETPIEDSTAPIKDSQGRIVGVVMVFRDVTEPRRHEEALRAGEALKDAILKSALDCVVTIDHEGRIIEFNPAAERTFGYSRADLLGKPMAELLIPPSYRAQHLSALAHHLNTGVSSILGKRIEVAALRADGSQFPVELAIAPIQLRNSRFFTAYLRDISDRKHFEEERERLLAAEQDARLNAENASQAKSQFLAVLSHELRTPLNPILLATTALLERPAPHEEVRPTLEMIRQNVMLQSRLIDDLLDVMRIIRGKMPLHWEVADCHALIHQAVAVCRSEIFGKELRIALALEATEHHLNADSARLQQVLWNLVKNAVKFTPSGGTITIRTRDEPSLNGDAEGRLVIAVADTGIGIEPDILPKIFDPFQQGETSITRKYGGMGLGLAICRGIVEAHGGVLSVDSPGKNLGTTFTIRLKAMPSPAVESADGPPEGVHAQAAARPSTLKILVVEDEPTTLRLMAKLLRGLGHEVTTANTIGSARETEAAGRFDLIISDIGLPDGSGLELMRQVTARRGRVPAIALTGYGMEEDIRRSREAGFTAHLTKPIDFTKLEAMIRQVVQVLA